ncbi:MAG: hypothetical protein ACYDAC_12750, partial [Candidatus Dormibacteria bacterium]
MENSIHPPRRRARCAALCLAAGLLTLAGHAAPVLAGDQTGQPVHTVGQLPPGGCGEDALTVDSRLGVLLRLEDSTQGVCPTGAPATTVVTAFSTSSLRQLARATVAVPHGYRLVHLTLPVVDPVRHRFMLVAGSPIGYDLDVYDLRQLLAGANPWNPIATTALSTSPPPGTIALDNPAGQDISVIPDGLSYDPATDTIQMLMSSTSPGDVPASVHGPNSYDEYVLQLDGQTLAAQWWEELGQCAFPFLRGAGGGIPDSEPVMRVHPPGGGDSIVTGCGYVRGPTQVLPGNTTGGSSLTYVIPLDGNGTPTGAAQYYLGTPGVIFGVADPADSRVFYPTLALVPGGAGTTTAQAPAALAFDATHDKYIGDVSVSVPGNQGYRVIASGGRLYSAGPGGLIVAASGETPLGQGVSYPLFNCYVNQFAADPGTRRVFLEMQSDCMGSSPFASHPTGPVLVVQDDTSVEAASSVDPDSYTTGAAESSGTTAQYQGHTAGTAVRALLIGGSSGLVSGATLGFLDAVLAGLPSDTATHETDVAQVTSGDLDNFQSNAAATPAAADNNTKGQLTPSGQPWPFGEASCSASSGTSGPVTTNYQGDSATVTCDPTTGSTTTHAVAGPLSFTTTAGIPMLTGSGEVSTSTVRDPTQGMVTTVTSSAHGVVIGPIEIQAITAKVVCIAHGRAGTAGCTYTRSISGITNAGVPVAGGSCTGGASDPCPQVVAALNAIMPGLVIFSTPSPDQRSDYLGGSPGGYQAVAQRELYTHLQDSILNYDASLQVPALEMLYVNDSPTSRSRLDQQWASVQAESHYGIEPVTQITPFGGGGGGTPGTPGQA